MNVLLETQYTQVGDSSFKQFSNENEALEFAKENRAPTRVFYVYKKRVNDWILSRVVRNP